MTARDRSRHRTGAAKSNVLWIALIALGLVVALIGRASAGGFALEEQTALAGGTGGASTARSGDPGAAWYNPAALADDGGVRLGIGVLAAFPSLRAEAMDGSWQTNSQSNVATPPHLNLSYAEGELAYGVSVGVPYGAGVTWPADWAGRHEILSTQLEVFRAGAFVAWRFGKLRVAGGVHVDFARLRINRTLDFVDTEGDVKLDMTGNAIGFDVAAFYQATPELDVGLSYKSRSSLAMTGGADFTAPDAFAVKTTDQHVATTVNLPDRIALGARWRAGKLSLLGDLIVTLWGVNQQTVIDFEIDDTPDVIQTNRWSSTVGLRLGAEYALTQAVAARGGAFYDPSPAPAERLAPTSPDSHRVGLTVGGSYRVAEGYTVDLFYEYMHILSRETMSMDNLAARYGGRAQMIGLGLRHQQ